ncbi:MAG: cupin domain-containing protein [Spongiibacteraceae bacterium]|jgi:1,2-dihydroxy-3-keto-5-methylthiopentene dioxygenase|nr:cupin domain-containing protein [Spongiibacteraceae bacterium]
MSTLQIFHEHEPEQPLRQSSDAEEIAQLLDVAGVRFEQWQANNPVAAGAPQEEVIEAYRGDIERLKRIGGYQTVDVISIGKEHPDKEALRRKFLSEHTHSEDEVRFFVAGRGLFSLHIGESIYEVLCERGDLLSVPANTPHWFDLGGSPELVAIRLFNNPEGWVARYTGSNIAERFSRLD